MHSFFIRWLNQLPRILMLVMLCIALIGEGNVHAQSQTEHSASFAARNGWQSNPSRQQDAVGGPAIVLDGGYLGSKNWGEQTLRFNANVRKTESIGFDLDLSDASADLELNRKLNPFMHAWMSVRFDRVSDFERHWRERGQWSVFERTSSSAQTGVKWSLERKSGAITISKHALKYDDFKGYDRNEFKVEATFQRQIFKKVKGAYKLSLVNPQRTKEAGTLLAQFKYDQLGFINWFSGGELNDLEIKSLDPVSSASLAPAAGLNLYSPRLWLRWSAKTGYVSPKVGGWQWGADVSGSLLEDQGAREFDQIEFCSRMWLEFAHGKWHWWGRGEMGKQSFRTNERLEQRALETEAWWRWNFRSLIGYELSASTQAVLTLQYAGMEGVAGSVLFEDPGTWMGASVLFGIQWRQTSRSKWAPPVEDFNVLFMK